MAELEVIELLKVYAWQDNQNYVGPRVGWAEVVQQLDDIIAALEDRDRLRAALATITHVVHVEHGIHTHVSLWVNHAKVGTLVLRTEEYEVFRAAQEGRDG